MKLTSKPLFGLCAVAAGAVAVFCLTHVTSCWGKDSTPQPVFKVSSTPIQRDASLGNSYAPIVKKAAPSVVNIYSTRFIKQRLYSNPMMADPFFRQFFGNRFRDSGREFTRRENWLGSGIIVTPDGYILTANHVVDGADEIKVGVLNDKTVYSARVIGTDPATDIAVLKIEAQGLPAITLGDSSQLEVGDVVLAIGNPFGLGQTVTRGIISALGRSLPDMGDDTVRYQDFIQTDASINKGNSGGALVDAEGRLIGINDAIVSPSGTSAGVGFAVPINLARHVLEGFVNGGKVSRGYLGVFNLQDIDAGLARQFQLPGQNGALIGDVVPGTPAAKAGLQSGDVIIAVNDKKIQDVQDLQLTVSQLSPGALVSLKVIRNGASKNIAVTLAELPGGTSTDDVNASGNNNSMPDALDGVTVADLTPQVREQLHMPDSINGALVADVNPDSNSADADLRPNDVIVGINRQPVKNADAAVNLCKAAKGDEILVKVWRRVGSFAGTRYLSVDNTKRAQ